MTTQLRLLDPDLVPWQPPDPPDIKGETYDPALDGARVKGEWLALDEETEASLRRFALTPGAEMRLYEPEWLDELHVETS